MLLIISFLGFALQKRPHGKAQDNFMETQQDKRLIILDCNSIIHRAYHALPKLITSRGETVNAVYGFLLVFFRVIKEFHPSYMAAAFDYPAPSFRRQVFKGYKAKRLPAPQDLYDQIPKIKDVLKAFNVPVFEKEGFEADDIIGTIAHFASQRQIFPRAGIIIISGDGDTLQLADDFTQIYFLRRGVKDVVLYDKKKVQDAFSGLNPEQLLDFKALRGDPSDNIPGVTGIGDKTAKELLAHFRTLENLYAALENGLLEEKKVRPKVKELLVRYKEQAFLSRQLATIRRDALADFNLSDCRWGDFSKDTASKALAGFDFSSLISRIPEPNTNTT